MSTCGVLIVRFIMFLVLFTFLLLLLLSNIMEAGGTKRAATNTKKYI